MSQGNKQLFSTKLEDELQWLKAASDEPDTLALKFRSSQLTLDYLLDLVEEKMQSQSEPLRLAWQAYLELDRFRRLRTLEQVVREIEYVRIFADTDPDFILTFLRMPGGTANAEARSSSPQTIRSLSDLLHKLVPTRFLQESYDPTVEDLKAEWIDERTRHGLPASPLTLSELQRCRLLVSTFSYGLAGAIIRVFYMLIRRAPPR